MFAEIKKLCAPDNFSNWFTIAREYVVFAVTVATCLAAYRFCQSRGWSIWWMLPVYLVAVAIIGGWVQNRLSVLVHEASHYLLFKNRVLNDLAANLFLLVGVMSLFGATLTLPGFAGLVLTVGMAVDANVIIFERIREELRVAKAPRAAINTGFNKALWTILDANITTFITAIVLFEYGTGPIKGFAVTLSIGVVTSVFAALVITRLMFAVYPGTRPVEGLSI